MKKSGIEITDLEIVKNGYVMTDKQTQKKFFVSKNIEPEFYPGRVVIPLWLAESIESKIKEGLP